MKEKNTKQPLVAILTNNDDDIYCFRKELIEALLKNGYRVLVSCPYGEKFELMTDIPFLYDDPVIDRRGTDPIADGKLLLHYRKLFREHRPFAVLAYTAKPNVYGSLAARSLGIPVLNNLTGFGSALDGGRLKRGLIVRLFQAAYRGSACIMFQNEVNMRLAKRLRMIRGKGRLIPGSGVDTERFPLLPYPEGGDGKHGETVVFNYIGRVLHDKGVDDYIEAARRIRAEYPKTEFNMLGFIEPTESHYEKDLAELEEAGIVHYRGSQKDVHPFIERAHAIIHPSTYGEGMSNVLLENASSGRPVITTDNPGCRETCRAEVSGFIYPGGDVDALVAAIKRFLALPNAKRREMGLAGRKRMEKHFSRDIVVKAYLEELELLKHA
ncbi:MAG: glycosyltransferase family 4 protein [Lachnospiraceae bacterium]|nr:glycosyltransferase family 4 protein [Lachnospiraceae bacterium]MBR1472592.1 glycosyltransferase family 4 protein [Lachnospiraceae bacterium]